MNDKTVFDLPGLPARLDALQAALLLGFQEYEIQVLMQLKLLKPLGSPAQNAHKYFSSAEILQLSTDRDWLDKATRSVARHWKERPRKHDKPLPLG
jgi:hypothetical protein